MLERLGASSPWARWALAGAALAAAWAVLAVWTPPDDGAWTLCLFRRLTHHDCATCGMTRALARLAKGDLAGAAARHPLAPWFAGETLAGWLAAPLAIARRWRPSPRAVAWTASAHLAILLAVWLVRLLSGRI